MLVKIYGNRPIKLLKITIKKIERRRIVLPGKACGPSKVFISKCRVVLILWKEINTGLGINQNDGLIIRIKRNPLTQFGNMMIDEEGSNTENKLFIIFTGWVELAISQLCLLR